MKRNVLNGLIILIFTIASNLFAGENFEDTMNKIVIEYMQIKDTLANDKTEDIQDNAKVIFELAKKLDISDLQPEHIEHFKNIPIKISEAAKDLSKAQNIKSMRLAFNNLSKPMTMWATMMKPEGINVAYCSMAPGSWLQTGKEIRNPYYGASMLKCGEIVSEGKKGQDTNFSNSCPADKEKGNIPFCKKCEQEIEKDKDK